MLRSSVQIKKYIEQRGIDRMHFVSAEIPKQVIYAFKTLRDVLTVLKIDYGKSLRSVRMHEPERSFSDRCRVRGA